jgi:hypothetical protein
MSKPCNIDQPHCRSCGSTNEEDIGWSAREQNEGYSDCCNKIIEIDNTRCRNNHNE